MSTCRRHGLALFVAVGMCVGTSACGGGSTAAVVDGPAGSPSSDVPAPSVPDQTLSATTSPRVPPVVSAAPVPATTAPPAPSTAAAPEINIRPGDEVSPADSVGEPLSISIPVLGVESELVPTGVLPDGTIDVPASADIAGWFDGGPRPGERGPAVIMGHVDSKVTGPGVFWGLRDLEPNDVVTVQTTTGSTTFVVQSVQQYPKDMFPTADVYGPVPEPALRLITCGGSFDRSIGHYRDNIVVFLTESESS